jgi:hypothetical protein
MTISNICRSVARLRLVSLVHRMIKVDFATPIENDLFGFLPFITPDKKVNT